MFEAIEQAKKDIEANEKEEHKEFFYFNESARKRYEENQLRGFSPEDDLNSEEMRPKLEQNKLFADNMKSLKVLKEGEESMASEFLGISKMELRKNSIDEEKESIVPVVFDLDFRTIVTKGMFSFGFLFIKIIQSKILLLLMIIKFLLVIKN
jgi:hypothetical protein